MPHPDFSISQNDTASVLSDTLLDADGDAVDIEGAAVKFHMRELASTTVKVNAVANNNQVGDGTDGTTGRVSYPWGVTDTNTAGFYIAEWQVTYASGKVQTFPNEGFILINVQNDID